MVLSTWGPVAFSGSNSGVLPAFVAIAQRGLTKGAYARNALGLHRVSKRNSSSVSLSRVLLVAPAEPLNTFEVPRLRDPIWEFPKSGAPI